MIIDFSYREIALIRELVKKERYRLFQSKNKIYKIKDSKDMKILQEHSDKQKNPWTAEGLCNRITEKINNLEDKIKNELGVKKS